MDDSAHSIANKRKLDVEHDATAASSDASEQQQQQQLVEAMAEDTNVEEEAQDARPTKRVRMDEVGSTGEAVGPQDPLASDAAPAGPPLCRFLPPSSLVYSNPDGLTGQMSPLKPHPIRWAIERRLQLENESKVARGEAIEPDTGSASAVQPDVTSAGVVADTEANGETEWTYHLREKDVGINEYLSAGLGQMQGIIKQR